MNSNHQHEFLELIVRLMADTRPLAQADGAFLFGQTVNNQASVFRAAHRMVQDHLSQRILILETDAKSGYPGYPSWRKELIATGIPAERIEGVPIEATTALNTLIESQALVRWARRKGYRTLFIVAAPFHQPRAFMTAATVAAQEYPDLRLYSYPGEALSWVERAAHSQGTLIETRNKLIAGELERITRYRDKGDLAGVRAVLDYLDARD